jgi:hypothetical protein
MRNQHIIAVGKNSQHNRIGFAIASLQASMEWLMQHAIIDMQSHHTLTPCFKSQFIYDIFSLIISDIDQ